MAGTVLGSRTTAVRKKTQVNGHSNPLVTLTGVNLCVSPTHCAKRAPVVSPGLYAVPRTRRALAEQMNE